MELRLQHSGNEYQNSKHLTKRSEVNQLPEI